MPSVGGGFYQSNGLFCATQPSGCVAVKPSGSEHHEESAEKQREPEAATTERKLLMHTEVNGVMCSA